MLNGMEKFRIAQYGFIQMVALAYGILSSGLMMKAAKYCAENGGDMPPRYGIIATYHDYGVFLSIIIIVWAAFCAYHSTIFSRRNINEGTIVTSGLIISGVFFVLGTFMFVAGIDTIFSPIPLLK